jgi:hypothetical protein
MNIQKFCEKWHGVEFESSSGLTPQFAQFYLDFKRSVVELAKPSNLRLESISRGHFYISGFLKNEVTGKFVYFSCSDVRFLRNEWETQLLIRQAQDDKDYSGGTNYFCSLLELINEAAKLSA